MRGIIKRLPSIAVLVALSSALAACGGGGLSGWDPTDMLDFLDTKKKLPGDRKPVFPQGVPGLQPGVPKEYYQGAQAEPDAVALPAQAEESAEAKPSKRSKSASRSEPKAAVKRASSRPETSRSETSRPEVQVAPPDANVSPDEGEPAAVPEPPPGAKPKVARRRTTAPPPDSEPAASPAQPAQASSTFPAPLPSGSFSR